MCLLVLVIGVLDVRGPWRSCHSSGGLLDALDTTAIMSFFFLRVVTSHGSLF